MPIARQKRDDILVGLDIGTKKICVVVGERNALDSFDIIGIGSAPSRGVTKGQITDLQSTMKGIQHAVKEAEMMAGCYIHEVYVNISGRSIHGENSRGMVLLRNGEVRHQDVERAREAARAVRLEPEQELLHVIPQQYIIDDQMGIQDPLNMSGHRLEVVTHVVSSATRNIQDILKCLEHCKLTCAGIFFDGIAAAEAVLHQDEKDLGVALVDIGAGTTDLVIVSSGSVVHSSVIPVGGNHISNDIAVALAVGREEAERIKISHGCAKTSLVRQDETVRIPMRGGRRNSEVNRRVICDIIEPRLEELFRQIKNEIIDSGMHRMVTYGVVLTGGTTHMDGICELAGEVMGLSVRKGNPHGLTGLSDVVRSPIYSTSVGLIQHAIQQSRQNQLPEKRDRWWRILWTHLRNWLSEYF